jgi:hypothetical protein
MLSTQSINDIGKIKIFEAEKTFIDKYSDVDNQDIDEAPPSAIVFTLPSNTNEILLISDRPQKQVKTTLGFIRAPPIFTI